HAGCCLPWVFAANFVETAKKGGKPDSSANTSVLWKAIFSRPTGRVSSSLASKNKERERERERALQRHPVQQGRERSGGSQRSGKVLAAGSRAGPQQAVSWRHRPVG
ncbi:unnamed protein product, partial [Ectocarpus sp. 6 AP-2014]